jgi:hypothetical protein
MKSITVDALPGVIALFLLDGDLIRNDNTSGEKNGEGHVESKPVISIVSPYGFNHRNINISAIENPSSCDFSLIDIYSNKDLDLNDQMKTSSISDNLCTPLTAIPFSTTAVEQANASTKKLIDVVMNTTLEGIVAKAPKIYVDVTQQSTTQSTRSSSKKGKQKGIGKVYMILTYILLCIMGGTYHCVNYILSHDSQIHLVHHVVIKLSYVICTVKFKVDRDQIRHQH